MAVDLMAKVKPRTRSIIMAVFKPLIHEVKETIADICHMWGLPHHWISPNPFFTNQHACA